MGRHIQALGSGNGRPMLSGRCLADSGYQCAVTHERTTVTIPRFGTPLRLYNSVKRSGNSKPSSVWLLDRHHHTCKDAPGTHAYAQRTATEHGVAAYLTNSNGRWSGMLSKPKNTGSSTDLYAEVTNSKLDKDGGLCHVVV